MAGLSLLGTWRGLGPWCAMQGCNMPGVVVLGFHGGCVCVAPSALSVRVPVSNYGVSSGRRYRVSLPVLCTLSMCFQCSERLAAVLLSLGMCLCLTAAVFVCLFVEALSNLLGGSDCRLTF